MLKALSTAAVWLLFLFNCGLAADIKIVNLPYWPSEEYALPCNGLYLDSSKFTCYNCPTNQIVDVSTLGGDGNYAGCTCQPGFVNVLNDCSAVSRHCTLKKFLPILVLTFRITHFACLLGFHWTVYWKELYFLFG